MIKLRHHSLVACLHFLNIAEASLAEIGYCLHVAGRLGYVSDSTLAELEAELNAVGAPLMGLVRSTRLMPIAIPLLALTCGVAGGAVTLIAQHFL